jgi:hypothetical protein
MLAVMHGIDAIPRSLFVRLPIRCRARPTDDEIATGDDQNTDDNKPSTKRKTKCVTPNRPSLSL